MPSLPEYVPNAQVSVGPLVDSSSIYEGYKGIANDVEETTRPIAQQLANTQAENDGSVAGMNPNFKTVPSFGQAAKVFNEAGLAANKQQVGTNIMTTLNGIHRSLTMDANGNPIPASQSSIDSLNSQGATYLHTLLSSVPKENRAFVQNEWTSKMTDIQSTFHKALFKQHHNTAVLSAYDSAHTLNGEISMQAENGNRGQALSKYGQQVQNINSNVKYGIIGPEEGSKLKIASQQSLQVSWYKGEIKRTLNNIETPYTVEANHQINLGKANEIVSHFENDSNVQSMFHSPLQMRRAVNILKSQIQSTDIKVKSDHAEIARQNKAQIDQAVHTGTYNLQDANTNMSRMTRSDKDFYWTKLQASALGGQNLQKLKFATQSQAQAINGQINDANSKLNWNDPERADIYQAVGYRVQKEAKQIMIDRKKPYTFIQDNPAYQAKIKNINSNPSSFTDIPLAKTNAALDIQRSMEYTDDQLEPIAKDSAIALHTKYKSMSGPEQYQFITQSLPAMVGNSPKAISLTLRQMQRESGDSSPSPYMFASVVRNPNTSQYADDVAAAFKEPTSHWMKSISGTSQKDIRAAVTNQSSGILGAYKSQGMTDDQLSKYVDSMTNAAAYMMSNKSEDLDTASSNSSDIFLGKQLNVNSLNSKSYVLPNFDLDGKKIDPEDAHAIINQKLRSISDGDLGIPNNIEPNVTDPHKRAEDYRAKIINSSYVANVGGTTIQFKDFKGNFIKDSKGKTYKLQYSEFNSPDVEQKKAIMSYMDSDAVTSGMSQAMLGG
tara:strand:- start:411 stop:2741 length:2331 start_codon:yes stop_codon:yes gene_type:complete